MVMRAMGAWMRKKKKRETMTVTCKKWSQTGEKGIEIGCFKGVLQIPFFF